MSSQAGNAAKRDFISRFSDWSLRWVPDSMVFVLALSVLVYFMALGLTPSGPVQIVDHWVKGFWVLLTFAMQMCILMITGFVVADSRQVRGLLKKLALIPKTPGQAIISFSLLVGFLWWVHWGVGYMAGIMLGRELVVAQRGKKLHYTAVAAAVYAGIVVANGPSMAAQLLVATPGHFIEKVVGVIPLSLTTFDPILMAMNLVLLVSIPFVFYLLLPKNPVEADEKIIKEFTEAEKQQVDKSGMTPAQRWDRSPVFMWIVSLAGLFWVGKFFVTKGIVNLDLNTLNFTFLVIGALLHGTPDSFMESVKRATGTVFGVIIQFPFYAGIFGMISYSGLAKIFANWFVAISTPETFPFIVFVYSGFLNFFVPSGGSKFVIEAPYILPAAQQLGANVNYVINAYTSGDLTTNLLQPFWALPVLGAFRLTFRDILPYGFVICLWTVLVISVTYLVFMH
ncbi:MAG: TIGR00366 family protein [Syntrophales bacterium]